MKRLLLSGLTAGLALLAPAARAQATLGTSPYTETFDNLASGLPAGFAVYTAATPSTLGTAATFAPAPGSWKDATAGFKNFASATGQVATTAIADQNAATNRALGVRQTGAVGDPGAAFAFQAANTTGKTDFALTFKLQSLDNTSPRTTSWQVDYGLGANPTSFIPVGAGSTTGGSTFTSNAVTVSFGGALDNVTGPVWIRVIALTGSTGGGNRASTGIDDFALSWSANPTAPALTATPAALAFGNQNINLSSPAQTYTLTGANLTGGVTLTTADPFSVSKDGIVYTTLLTYTAADLAAAKTVSVRFTPTTTGPASGTVTNTSPGATARTVVLTGNGTDPTQTVFDFNTCTGSTTISDGWIQYSVVGPQVWACTTFGRDPNAPAATTAFPNAVQINGYDGTANTNVTNEDWLISPALALTNTAFPLLSYWSRTAFNGPPLRLLVSTNYAGTGSPNAAGITWTDLNAPFPAQGTAPWVQTQNVDLSAYKTAGVHVAFVYNSTTDEGARWTLDDVVLTNSATAPPAAVRASAQGLGFGYQAVGTAAQQTLNVTATNLTGDLAIASSSPAFQLSKDGTAFSNALTYPQVEASGKTLAVRVRFTPTAANTTYAATATVTSPGVTALAVGLTGNTYDVANTLEVVNWNMEWFGSSAAGLGPKDKNLQYINAGTVLKALNADVYALLEVVDTVRLRNLVAAMPGYAYRVSGFGSFADDSLDVDYAGAQKLAFVYRTSVVGNPKFSAFFRTKQAQAAPDYSYWSSGRFPYVMQANVTLNGVSKPVTFVAIHAKANTSPTATSYARRKSASDELKAKLDADYAGKDFMVLGDINDDLDQTITAGITPPITSYSAFTNDAANYPSPTLQELSLMGKKSTVSYNDVIDHVITSKSLYTYYLKGTAEAQTGIAGTIPNYGTTTSDHYPVLTRYSFAPGTVTGTKARSTAALALYPNPAGQAVRLDVPEASSGLRLLVHTATGQLVLDGRGTAAQLNQQLNQRLGSLQAGVYLLQVVGAQQTYVNRLLKQ